MPAMSDLIQEDVDPSGDLILSVGPQQFNTRVSSKVLSLASPVFAAMLSANFAEGQSLLTSATDPAETPSLFLPDDDPEAMHWFCRALHHNMDVNKKKVGFDLCLELAELCDKYDASVALSGCSNSWIESLEEETMIDDRRCLQGLCIAYAFDNHQAFWHITRNVMEFYTVDELDKNNDVRQKELLPSNLIGESCPASS